ncbi:MAG TPA: hypothetical protein VIU61_08840 [Kofleriaceae bacterium]
MRAFLIAIAFLAGCGGGSSADGNCVGLALDECRLEPGCKVDACEGCSCTPSYRGCIAASRTPAECPLLGCPSPQCCDEQADCSNLTDCVPPGTPFACGSCNSQENSCTTDGECKAQRATAICEPIPCSCDGNKACTEGCVDDTMCAQGQTCDTAANRCQVATCDDAGDCPPNFGCDDGLCIRAICTDDTDCVGFCVEGSCHSSLGECRGPSA